MQLGKLQIMNDKKSSPWDLYGPIEKEILESDTGDPSVFQDKARIKSPAFKLVRQFFLTAMSDCFSDNQSIKRDAIRWINSNDQSYVLSFIPTCTILNLDPDAVRLAIRNSNEAIKIGFLRELRNAS